MVLLSATFWRQNAALVAIFTFAIVMMLHPTLEAAAAVPSASSSSSSGSKSPKSSSAATSAQQQRQENLDFALTALNRLAATTPILRMGAGNAPVYTIEEVFTESTVDTQGDLVTLVPVYRTVRGYDEKRRRPVLYQTLMHEERPVREVVDRSVTYHIVLRKQTPQELLEIAEHLEHLRKKECATNDKECLASQLPPDPLQFIHALVTVSVDKDHSRTITMLRSASRSELRAWWVSHATKLSDAGTMTSEAVAKLMEQYEALALHSFLPLPKLLASGGFLSPESELHKATSASLGSKSGTLKAMSVNLWNYNYWTRRVALISSVLRSEAPDLIGFQEVRAIKQGPGLGSTGEQQNRWQVADLAAMLPDYEFVYQPAMGFRQERDYVHEGLAIFSKFPIEQTDGVKLTRDPQDGQDFHQRLCLHAQVRTPWGKVHMMTTHLSLSLQARTRTLPEVSAFANSFASEPTILVGDFNAQLNEGPSILLRPEFGAFQDAWLVKYGTEQDVERKGWTFHTWDHRSRIDFVFFKAHEGRTSPMLDVEKIDVVGKEGKSLHGEPLPPIGGVAEMKDIMYPSDHMFLSTVFRVERKQVTTQEPAPTAAAASSSTSSASQSTDDTDAMLKRAQALAAQLTESPENPHPLKAGVTAPQASVESKNKDEL